MDDEQQHAVFWAARLLRGEVIRGAWNQLKTVHLHSGLTIEPAERLAIRWFRALSVSLPETGELDLGLVQVDLPVARVDPDSLAQHDDHTDVRLVPAGSNIALFRHRPHGPEHEEELPVASEDPDERDPSASSI